MTRGARPTLKIDVLVVSDRWKKADQARSIVRRAVTRAAAATPSTAGAELAIVLTDDSAIRLLNRDWRGIDAATNVLSFPTKKAAGKHLEHLGDIVLAFETIAREARGEHKPLAHHVAHLAVHGFLHLVGYDHENDKDATDMERAEREILRQLAIPDPYRAGARSKSRVKTRVRPRGESAPGTKPARLAAARLATDRLAIRPSRNRPADRSPKS
jgi:probable rRNA maturation factor